MADKEARSRITDDSGKKLKFHKKFWISFPGFNNKGEIDRNGKFKSYWRILENSSIVSKIQFSGRSLRPFRKNHLIYVRNWIFRGNFRGWVFQKSVWVVRSAIFEFGGWLQPIFGKLIQNRVFFSDFPAGKGFLSQLPKMDEFSSNRS